ncbi:phosphoethanolamine transferase [Bacteroides sp.]
MWKVRNMQTVKEQGRIGLLFLILFLPCLFALFTSSNLQEGISVKIGYLFFYTLILVLPLAVLKSRTYFLFEGIFVLLAPLEITHLRLLGMPVTMTFITSVMQTDFRESLEALSSFKYEMIAALLIWIIYFTQLFKIKNVYLSNKKIRITLIPAFLLLNILLYAYMFKLTSVNDNFSRRIATAYYNTTKKYTKIYPVNFIFAYIDYSKDKQTIRNMDKRVENFSFHANSLSPRNEKEIYILIIGEAARSDHFSLNGYPRETMPNLKQIKNIVSFNNTYSTANYTVKAIPLLISRATPETFQRAYQEKTLPEMFKECGFFSAWIANQSFNDPYIVRIARNLDYSHFELTDFDSQNNYDEKLLPELDKLLAENKPKTFIVIHTLGSHFRYNYRYPKEFEKFCPGIPKSFSYGELSLEKKEQLINSYDNSIVYTDYILSEIIKKVQKQQCISAVTYISDHAENLYDDAAGKAMHGSSDPNRYEIHIPFITWLSDEYTKQYPDVYKILNQHRRSAISTNNLFYTMADIGNISYSDEHPEYSVASLEFKEDSVRSVLKPDDTIKYFHK